MISNHPLVGKEIKLNGLKPDGVRSVKLYLIKAGVKETYLDRFNKLQFKRTPLQPEKIYNEESPESSLTNKGNMSAKDLINLYGN